MEVRTSSPVPVASRIGGFVYAIRNIVTEARKVEAAGRRVRYLNIGDPITFGFETPPHMIEAVDRAMRDGQNGYAPSVGILAAREAVAAECDRRGMPVSPDRVVITSGTSEGIELALTALAEAGDEVLVPVPTYPFYTAVLAKIGAQARCFTGPIRPVAGCRTSSTSEAWSRPRRVRSSSSTRTTRPARPTPSNAARAGRARRPHNIPLLADEVYADLAFDGPVRRSRRVTPTRRSSRSRRCRRRISRRAGAQDGWRSATRRAWTMRWPPSRSSRTAGCARPDRWSTRSSPRSTAIAPTRLRFARRCSSAPS